MANFTTHIAVGTVAAGALATLTLAADVVAPENLIAVTMAGVLGSVLPDIDLKDSRAGRTMFAGLGIFFSFAVLFSFATKFSIAELWILWLGTLVTVRYGVFAIFHRVCVHRGVWHSIVAALFCSAATAVVFYHVLGRHEGVAWLAGAFMFIGFIVHLVLDEMYSVDVMDTRIKASFGTALKLADLRHPYASLAMVAATVAAIYVSPPIGTFAEGVRSRDMWSGLSQRLLPEDKWFGVIDRHGRTAVAADPVNGVTTGSIPETNTEAPASR
jgi:hypothetical protein